MSEVPNPTDPQPPPYEDPYPILNHCAKKIVPRHKKLKQKKMSLKKMNEFYSTMKKPIDNMAKKCHDLGCEHLLASRGDEYFYYHTNLEKSTADEDNGRNEYKEIMFKVHRSVYNIQNIALDSLLYSFADGTFFKLFIEHHLDISINEVLQNLQLKNWYKYRISSFFSNFGRRKLIQYVPPSEVEPLEIEIWHDRALFDSVLTGNYPYWYFLNLLFQQYDQSIFQKDFHKNKLRIRLPFNPLKHKMELYHIVKAIERIYFDFFKKKSILISNAISIVLHLGLPKGWEKRKDKFGCI